MRTKMTRERSPCILIRRAHGEPMSRGNPLPHGPLMVKAIGYRLSLFNGFPRSFPTPQRGIIRQPMATPWVPSSTGFQALKGRHIRRTTSSKLLFSSLRRSMLGVRCSMFRLWPCHWMASCSSWSSVIMAYFENYSRRSPPWTTRNRTGLESFSINPLFTSSPNHVWA
jgi:hypothetical protein